MSKINDTFFTYVDTNSEMTALIHHLKKANRVAVDIEADSLHHYFQKVCLIQIAIGKMNFIVDPISDIDLAEFLDVLSQKIIIFHAGDYDLRMMKSTFGFEAKNVVFDTFIAGQFLGIETLSLVALADIFLGVELTKSGQKSDWSRRPLTNSQLEYAVDDIQYLEALADKVQAELLSLGRDQWHREACEWMVIAAGSDKSPKVVEDPWRIKRAGLLRSNELIYLKEIWHWREELAKELDRPPFKVIGNEQILRMASWCATNTNTSLDRLPAIPRNCTGKRLKALQSAITKARQTPEDEWPQKRRSRVTNNIAPDSKGLTSILKAECAEITNKLGIAAPLLAPLKTLKAIANQRPKSVEELREHCGMMNWQVELLKDIIMDNIEKEG